MATPSDKVLKFDYRGAPQTISVMRDAALSSQGDMGLRTVAESVCSGIDSKDYISEYEALYHYVLRATRYMRDPRTVELVRAPYIVARDLLAGRTPNLDCDDQATLLAGLVLAVGGTAEFITVAFRKMFYNGQQQYSHVLMRAQDPKTGRWTIFDPVAAEKTREMLSRVKAAKLWPIT